MLYLILLIGGVIFFIFPNKWGVRICLVLIALVAWHLVWPTIDVTVHSQPIQMEIQKPISSGVGPQGMPCVKYNDRGRIVQTECPSFR